MVNMNAESQQSWRIEEQHAEKVVWTLVRLSERKNEALERRATPCQAGLTEATNTQSGRGVKCKMQTGAQHSGLTSFRSMQLQSRLVYLGQRWDFI